jgi:hypothetical protein
MRRGSALDVAHATIVGSSGSNAFPGDRPCRTHPMEVHNPVSSTTNHELFAVGDEVTGQFRCVACDLLIVSPKENDGVLVLPACPLCASEDWRRVE